MCNLAGYIGKKNAAAILLEMMGKQEGFGGGYYSGIATLHEGKIYHAKVIGNFATLRRETDAENFPGTIGIAHTRPKLGGGKEWGHPFVNDSKTMALVANGHSGFFENLENESNILKKLEKDGQIFKTATNKKPDGHSNYPTLSDGRIIHSTELRCHYTSSLLDKCASSAEAIFEAHATYPAEIASLILCQNLPDKIIAGRFNQPLMIGFSSDAAYMASTAMAFPESEIEIINPMPISSMATISSKGMEIAPFNPNPGKVANVFPFAEACDAILKALAEGNGKTLQDLKNATAQIWPKNAAPQKDMLVYEILSSLNAQGKVFFKDTEVEGVLNTTASVKKAYLKQA